MKKLLLFLFILIVPFWVFAYSDYVALGGKTLGIKVDTKGVMVIGFYKVNGKYNKGNPNLANGDYIIKVNDIEVSDVQSLSNAIEKFIGDDYVTVTYIRKGIEKNSKLELISVDGVIKTGLFVKSSIMGIGTLSYIDPNTLIFGALGHEIVESNTNQRVEIKDGTIFNSFVTGIEKSIIGTPGSKIAKFNYNYELGNIVKNTKYGIFGIYNDKVDSNNLMKVGNAKIGSAVIKTVLNGNNEEQFNIEITKINETSDIKNITFKINDDRLISLTGGVIQGMSGSPIIQNEEVVGALTHVIVDNPYSGYGIFIQRMLEEGER